MAKRPKTNRRAPLEGGVRGVGHGGEGAVETDQGVVFVRGVLPGERVLIELADRRRGARRGHLRQLVSAAPERVVPACPLQDRCGGCPWMIWSERAQLEQKRRWVAEALASAERARFDPASAEREPIEVAISPSPDPLAYRRRARLHFRATGQGAMVGYRRAGSDRILDVPRCAVLAPPLQTALTCVRDRLAPALAGAGELSLGIGAGRRPVLQLRCEQPQPSDVYAGLRGLVSEGSLAGASLSFVDSPSEERIGDPRECFPMDQPDSPALWSAVGGFGQANEAVNRALVAWVVRAVADLGTGSASGAPPTILELYAGHGNFTVPLAARSAKVIAVEQHPGAAQACRDNLAAHGLDRARVVTAPVAPLPRLGGAVDVVVLDPPRTGAREVIEAIAALRPRGIVYVSCDPPTLGRDLSALAASGYRVTRARAFDMFPQTVHVEAAVVLTRDV